MDLSYEALRSGYTPLWERVLSDPNGLTRVGTTNMEAKALLRMSARARFDKVEQATKVPWFVTGIILTREAGSPPNFWAWLHNGDPMLDHINRRRQTTHVPANRPPDPTVSWEEGAVDAYTLEKLIGRTDWCPELVAWILEKFNGFGYRQYHKIVSPYLWGSTCVQQRGKYTSDRRWDPMTMDTQIGGMALLVALLRLAPDQVKFPTAVSPAS
jgi:lysozyme family protein